MGDAIEPLRPCGVCGMRVRPTEHWGAHTSKVCLDCVQMLELHHFAEHTSAADGFRRVCKACSARRRAQQTARPSAPDQPASSQSPSINVLIGTLVYRAVLWPMMRPLTGEQLEPFRQRDYLRGRASRALTVLESALDTHLDSGPADTLDDALALVDITGPSETSSFVRLWRSLDAAARGEVLRDIGRVVDNAAAGVSDFIRSVGLTGGFVTCAWSEVPLLAIDGFFRSAGEPEDRSLRADLVVWRQRGDIDVLDLKVGNVAPPDWVRERDQGQLAQYVAAVRRRVGPERAVRGSILRVGRGRGPVTLDRVSTTSW